MISRIRISLAIGLAALAAAPGASAAVPKDFVGIDSVDTFEYAFNKDANSLDANLRQQREAGIRVLRQPFLWRTIEPRKGRYDFAATDRFMAGIAHRGMKVLPVLFDAPRFRAKRPYNGTFYPPKRNSDFAAFASRVAKRYGPKGSFWKGRPASEKRTSAIRDWQIWNEPNLRIYWGKKPNAKQYVAMLKASHKAIRKVDRGAKIVGAGVPDSSTRGAIPLKKWFPAVYKAGGKKWFDVLAINAHSRTTKLVREKLVAARKAMRRGGDGKAPLWVTEVAWASSGPKSPYTKTAKGQAAEIRKAIAMLGKERRKLRLRGFFYYQWRDARPYRAGLNIWGLHSGLLKINGTPKPALSAFTAAVKKL